LGGSAVKIIKDYQSGESKNTASGETTAIGLPTSNVLQFITDDGSTVSVRPSGTEPKIKFYCSVNTELDKPQDFEEVTKQLEGRIDKLISDLTAESATTPACHTARRIHFHFLYK